MKSKKVNLVSLQDWNDLVQKTYGRIYNLQQQDGCMDRGAIYFTVPRDCSDEESEMHDAIPEVVNGNEMGVKFPVWLARNPKKRSGKIEDKLDNKLFWERNFYPLLQSVANDLHAKGLLKKGEYAIEIDW